MGTSSRLQYYVTADEGKMNADRQNRETSLPWLFVILHYLFDI